MMSNELSIASKRRPGRPRKKVQHANPLLLNNNRQPLRFSSKRKPSLLETIVDDVKLIEIHNGVENLSKKQKLDDNQRTRSQPHRAARFTDSYGGGSPDVVVLSDDNRDEDSESESDSDCSPMPSPVAPKRTEEEQLQLEINIQKLKKELNDEEMKLVLLRKLKESQKAKETKVEPETSITSCIRPNVTSKDTTIPEKNASALKLPSKHLLSTNKYAIHQQQAKKHEDVVPSTSSMHQKRPQTVQRPAKIETNDQMQNVPPTTNLSQKQFGFHQFPLLKNLSNQITITPLPATPTSTTTSKREEKIDAEALSQRQAAAKLALRKQLEKTLLQIPLPKPPPFKLGFFPNGNCIEFLCLLGLDIAVDFLTKTKKPTNTKNPLTCSQCKTDFTSMWKWKEIIKHGKKEYHVFCEACITTNMRKSLKAEHTNNLKAAFLKALQQEKEIDRLSLAPPKSHHEAPTSSKSHKGPVAAHQSKPTTHHHIPKTSTNMSHLPKSGINFPHLPKHGIDMNHTALAQHVAKLNPQLQNLLQAQAQHLLAAGVPLHPNLLNLSTFMPQIPHHLSRGKPGTSQNDLRRQYSSERVRSPVPQTKAGWHT